MSTESCFAYVKAQGGFQMPSKKEIKKSLKIAKKLNAEICRKKGECGNKSFSTR